MNEAQRQHWNGPDTRHWVDAQDRYDRQLEPFGERVLAAVGSLEGLRVLDIGCGCGTTTLTIAGSAAAALGVDVSAPMLDVARERAAGDGVAGAEFVLADAQTHVFDGSFDVAVSRFGVMFFDDPLAAFANIASALRPGGRLAFVCWQGLEHNDWLLLPGLAASAHLSLPDSPASGPGMFSLADRDATVALLDEAGFDDVEAVPFETPMLLGGAGTVDDAVQFLLSTGIARSMFEGAEPAAAAAAIAAVTELIQQHATEDGVRLGAATWIVTATARPR